ncbi:MAG: paraquat-inducible protein A, partial [Pseudomonadota bacterium]
GGGGTARNEAPPPETVPQTAARDARVREQERIARVRASRMARARARLTGPRAGLAAANLAVLIGWPIAWSAPLATAGLIPYFGGDAITIFSGVEALWENDPALAGLVALFAIAMPVAKTVMLALLHARLLTHRALPALDILGKLAMADVFLLALFIVLTKGVGVGYVTSAWGLWLFTGLVLAQMAIGYLTRRIA